MEKKISIKKDPKLVEYFKMAREVEKLRNQADRLEDKVKEKFRVFYEEKREALITEEANLKQELEASETEIEELKWLFCEQKGHDFSYRKFWGRKKFTYKTCVICGWSNDPEVKSGPIPIPPNVYRNLPVALRPKYYQPYKPAKALKLIKQAVSSENESDETAEWKKTGQRIIDLAEKTENKKARMRQIQSEKKELCSIFGHDFNPLREEKCKICGAWCVDDLDIGGKLFPFR